VKRVVVWAVLLLSALFLLTTGGTYPGIASVEAHIIGQVIAYVALGGWFLVMLVRPEWRPTTPLFWPVVIATGAYLLSFAFSQRPRLSLEPTIAGVGWAFGYLFISRLLREPWFRTRVRVVLIAFAALVAVGYIVQVVIEWIRWWNLIGFLAVPPLRPSFAGLWLGSPNLVATALLLVGPLAVVFAYQSTERRWPAAALSLAVLIAIFLSGSRGGWLGAAAGVGALVMLLGMRDGLRSLLRGFLQALRNRPIVLASLVIATAGLIVLLPGVLRRFAGGGEGLRLDLWRSALTIFGDHPIVGAGPGTWVQLKVEANPLGVPNLILPHAHDLYVQAAAEAGLVGLAALGALALAGLWRLWTGWQSEGSLAAQSAGVIVSAAAFAAQSLVDNLVNLPLVCLLVVVLAAWVDAGLTASKSVSSEDGVGVRRHARALQRGPAMSIIGLAGLVIAVPLLVPIDRAALIALEGNSAALRGEWHVALDRFDTAHRLDPGLTLYAIQTASALAHVGRTVEARDLLATAVASDRVAINVLGLAALEAELGDREAALAHAREAASLGIGEPVVALNVGLIAEGLNDAAFALDQFANAIAWNPPLASSGFWASPPRLDAKEEIVTAARSRVGQLEAALILAYSGQAATARADLEELPASAGRDVYLAVAEWRAGDTPAAVARLDAILAANAQDWFAAGWAARILRRSGDGAAAHAYERWALAVQGDAAPGTIRETSAVPATFDAPTANLPGDYPWSMYLRPIAPFLLMPQLVTIGEQ
jgi:O-antigen ligase/tetratricopeptide (TPR) repeat protein